jgi:predicted CXXCH cytochrome family protein
MLWNREDSTATYITYQSSTLRASVGQPTGSSKLCLSCHDGTIALGAVLSRPEEIPFVGGIRFLPEGPTRLGTDLSDDHPVSFVYDEALAADRGDLVSPSTLSGDIRLDASGMVQCRSCHDPHNDTFGKFLVTANNFSRLCLSCHAPFGWESSSHALSSATWNGREPDPWPHTDYTSVAENGCENCHRPHLAGGHARLLNDELEEQNCLNCHKGDVASTDIEAEMLKLTRHAVKDYLGIHDPAEDFTQSVTAHVECADCHNPHEVNAAMAPAPNVSGALQGVTGISASGVQMERISFAYEICFKCHADNPVTTSLDIARQHPQVNTRLEFDLINPSYHPVEGPGKNPQVPSLLPPYTAASIIYCTDCHSNDEGSTAGGTGPQGPHGSNYHYLLERNYTTTDPNMESPFEYALCYKCHNRDALLDNRSGFPHRQHLLLHNTPCYVCHDPHGISTTQGDEMHNTHLINFDATVVQPVIDPRTGQRVLYFEDLGTFRGQCYLVCHGAVHNPRGYGSGLGDGSGPGAEGLGGSP